MNNPPTPNKAVPDWAMEAAYMALAHYAVKSKEPLDSVAATIAAIIRRHAPSVPAVEGVREAVQKSLARSFYGKEVHSGVLSAGVEDLLSVLTPVLAKLVGENERLKSLWTEMRVVLAQSRDANCLASYGTAQVDAVEAANKILNTMPKDMDSPLSTARAERDNLHLQLAKGNPEFGRLAHQWAAEKLALETDRDAAVKERDDARYHLGDHTRQLFVEVEAHAKARAQLAAADEMAARIVKLKPAKECLAALAAYQAARTQGGAAS